MERAVQIMIPSLCVCDQPKWSINACNRCKTHLKNVWNQCSILFHYDCNFTIKNGEEFIKSAIDVIDYINENILDEGFKYRIDKVHLEFEECANDVLDRIREFKQKYKENDIDVFSLAKHSDEWKEIIRSIFESQAYYFIRTALNKKILFYFY